MTKPVDDTSNHANEGVGVGPEYIAGPTASRNCNWPTLVPPGVFSCTDIMYVLGSISESKMEIRIF